MDFTHADDRERRYEDALERLGTRHPQCSSCTESNPRALIRVRDRILCYECRARMQGKPEVEAHHVMGRHNDPFTVDLPTNDHRVESDMRVDWPADTIRNPKKSPLLRAAAALRGSLNLLQLLIDRTLAWIPPFLEWLDSRLEQERGEGWWVEWGYEETVDDRDPGT